MRRPDGYVTVSTPDLTIERDAVTCRHCQRIVLVKPGTASTVYLFPQMAGPDREEPGAFCRVCMGPVCLRCHDLGVCLPAERRLELMEAAGRGR